MLLYWNLFRKCSPISSDIHFVLLQKLTKPLWKLLPCLDKKNIDDFEALVQSRALAFETLIVPTVLNGTLQIKVVLSEEFKALKKTDPVDYNGF